MYFERLLDIHPAWVVYICFFSIATCFVFCSLTVDCQWLLGISVECRIAKMRCGRPSPLPMLSFRYPVLLHYARNVAPPFSSATYFQIDPRLQLWWAAAVAAVNPHLDSANRSTVLARTAHRFHEKNLYFSAPRFTNSKKIRFKLNNQKHCWLFESITRLLYDRDRGKK